MSSIFPSNNVRMARLLSLLIMTTCFVNYRLLPSTTATRTESFGEESFITWCHCMGRLGNQIDGFLGGLRVAKQLNRRVIVPPLVEYGGGRRYVPFSEYFNVSKLGEYHRYITMEDFMHRFSGEKWSAYCYSVSTDEHGNCKMREGQPSTGFWDHYNIHFHRSVPFHHSASPTSNPEKFHTSFPPSEHPVRDVPGPFPVLPKDRDLQRYVVFTDAILSEVKDALQHLPKPILSVHLRNGNDWKRACVGAVGRTDYMESPQCLDGETEITEDMCFPRRECAVSRIREVVERTGARSVYIGTDHESWLESLREELKDDAVRLLVSPFEGETAYVKDLAVFSTTEYFLGNCISSFTGFAVRYRAVNGLRSSFFGVPNDGGDGQRMEQNRCYANEQKLE